MIRGMTVKKANTNCQYEGCFKEAKHVVVKVDPKQDRVPYDLLGACCEHYDPFVADYNPSNSRDLRTNILGKVYFRWYDEEKKG